MADWPILATAKAVIPMTKALLVDPTIRSTMEDGSVVTRLRFPAVPRVWRFELRNIDNIDRAALETFEHTTVSYGSGTFNWYSEIDSAWYVVRMGAPFAFVTDDVADLWRTPVELVEASASQ